jgi:ankyrin repeat protein
MKKNLFLSILVFHGTAFCMDNEKFAHLKSLSPEERVNAIKSLANRIDKDTGLTLLNAACAFKLPLEQIEVLLKNGADPNTPSPNGQMYKGNYPLHYAAMHQNTPLKDLLIQFGADVTLKNEAGKTAAEIEKDVKKFSQFMDAFKQSLPLKDQ